jgi:HSP20 family molecular chaperone IbpA
MWSEALDMLARAEQLHRHVFRPNRLESRRPSWEPPVDVLETPNDVIVFTALPGVDPAAITTTVEGGSLVIFGERKLPAELHMATIHRLELPQGCFERRVQIPTGRYSKVQTASENGCLIIRLRKASKGR